MLRNSVVIYAPPSPISSGRYLVFIYIHNTRRRSRSLRPLDVLEAPRKIIFNGRGLYAFTRPAWRQINECTTKRWRPSALMEGMVNSFAGQPSSLDLIRWVIDSSDATACLTIESKLVGNISIRTGIKSIKLLEFVVIC